MSQGLKTRRELHAVAAIGKQEPTGAHWLDPTWHDPMNPNGYKFASTHNTSDAFRARQVARGMTIKDKAP